MRGLILVLLLMSCLSVCNAEGDIPIQPRIILVTTDSITQKAVIKWEPSPSPRIAHYVLYRFKGNLAPAVDTLPASARRVEYYKSNAANEIERYALCAIDSSNNSSIVDGRDEIIHQTIYLKAVRDTCTGQVNLSWNNYPALSSQISLFKLYTYKSDVWQLVQTLTNTTFSYNSNDAFTGNDEFLLEAIYKNYRIYSNHPKAPLPGKSFLHTENAFAQYNSEGCLIKSNIIGGNQNDTLIIYRTNNCAIAGVEIVRDFPYQQNQAEWIDKNISPKEGLSYLLTIKNRCGVKVQSTCIQPLGLFFKQDNEKFILYWTSLSDAVNYQINKIENGASNFLTSTSDTMFVYSPSNQLINEDVNWCFQVVATLNNGYQPSTQSNTLCFSPEPIIKLPEIFSPDGNGLNDYFKPVFIYSEPVNYQLSVYDKLGRLVFHSTKYDEKGWDGTFFNNQKALSGDVFIYNLEFTLKNGTHHIKRGNIAIYLPK